MPFRLLVPYNLAMTLITQTVKDNIALAQAFSAHNYDDAEYALAHASEFTPEELAVARETVASAWGADGFLL